MAVASGTGNGSGACALCACVRKAKIKHTQRGQVLRGKEGQRGSSEVRIQVASFSILLFL